jgi:hypothetical protein
MRKPKGLSGLGSENAEDTRPPPRDKLNPNLESGNQHSAGTGSYPFTAALWGGPQQTRPTFTLCCGGRSS